MFSAIGELLSGDYHLRAIASLVRISKLSKTQHIAPTCSAADFLHMHVGQAEEGSATSRSKLPIASTNDNQSTELQESFQRHGRLRLQPLCMLARQPHFWTVGLWLHMFANPEHKMFQSRTFILQDRFLCLMGCMNYCRYQQVRVRVWSGDLAELVAASVGIDLLRGLPPPIFKRRD
jgi:hypothetical protein